MENCNRKKFLFTFFILSAGDFASTSNSAIIFWMREFEFKREHLDTKIPSPKLKSNSILKNVWNFYFSFLN